MTLVVIEYGAAWPSWLSPQAHEALVAVGAHAPLGPPTRSIAAIAQHYEGHPSSLLTQVASRISRLERRDWWVDSVVLVTNGRVTAESTVARAVLARGLVARLRATGGALVLCCASDTGRRARRALEELGASLESESEGRVQVSLRVGAAAPHAFPTALAS